MILQCLKNILKSESIEFKISPKYTYFKYKSFFPHPTCTEQTLLWHGEFATQDTILCVKAAGKE